MATLLCLGLVFPSVSPLFGGRRVSVEKVWIENEEGVPFQIRSTIQDRQGFIWIHTDYGLYRFDGYEYHQIKPKRGNPYTIISDKVTFLFNDSEGRLWIGTEKGLSRYESDTGHFINYEHRPDEPSTLLDPAMRDITQDADGIIWVASAKGLNRLDRDEKSFRRHELPVPKPEAEPENDFESGFLPRERRINTVITDRSNRIWLGANHGLFRFDREKEKFVSGPEIEKEDGETVGVASAYADRDRLWLFLRSGEKNSRLVYLDESGETYHPFKLEGARAPDPDRFDPTKMLRDSHGRLWIGTSRQGVFRFEEQMRTWEHFTNLPEKENALFMGQVSTLMEDMGGIIWVGTESGLNKILLSTNNFFHLSSVEGDPRTLSSRNVRTIVRDSKGTLWVGTEKGLNRRPIGDRVFYHYFADPEDKYSLLDDNITRIVEDNSGRIYVATHSQIHLYRPKTDDFKRLLPKEEIAKFKYIFGMTADAWDNIWISGEAKEGHAITVYRANTGKISSFVSDPKNPGALPTETVFSVYTDSKERTWVATYQHGLSLYKPKKKKFVHFRYESDNPQSLGALSVYSIVEDKKGKLWMSTDEGLSRLDPETGKFRNYYGKDRVPERDLRGIVLDDKGYLWLSHEKGLTRYYPETREAVHYNLRDGLNNRFNWGSFGTDKKGEIYFGGSNGITYFHPKEVRASSFVPPLAITYIQSNEKGLTRFDMLGGEEPRLNHDGNYMKIGLTALDFSNPRRNLYRYKLEPRDDEWSSPVTNRSVYFKALDPGEYTLRLQGSNSNGRWSELSQELRFSVVPPFWRTKLAFLLYAIMIPSALYGHHQWRLRQIRTRAAELEVLVEERTISLVAEKKKTEAQAQKLLELDRLKTQFFSNVSHEFRTPLTLIIGPLETMLSHASGSPSERLQSQHEVMLRNARRLLRLINQLLDISKLEAGSMALIARPLKITKFVKPIAFAFHSLAKANGIKLEVTSVDDDLEVYFDPEKVEKILFNLLGNAFQFTSSGGEIKVAISVITDKLNRDAAQIAVSDTGTGIHPDQLEIIFDRFRQADGSITREREGTGIGLSLVKELVGLHRGEIWVETELGKGSTFYVSLPLGKNHLKPSEIRGAGAEEDEFLNPTQAKIELAHLRAEKDYAAAVCDGTLGESILIVDDHPDIRDYIKSAMSQQYRILEAVDGSHGLEVARKQKPDLIISDVMMPNMDGYEMCRQIRKDRDLKHIPIIMLTAKASDEMKVEGLEIGANDYLSKPFNVRELSARVRNLLSIREQERSMKRSLEMAHKAQVCMLPTAVPHIDGLDIASFSQPAREVGGDYFDFVMRDPRRLGVVIGDVSGKGMPAALYMTMAKGLVQAYSAGTDSPKEALSQINRQFHRASAANIFLSLQYALLDAEQGQMIISNAGHNPVLLHSPSRGESNFLKTSGMAVGLEGGEVFDKVVQDVQIPFHPGDVMLFYTDGIVEAMNDRNEVFGEDRLMEVIKDTDHLSAKDILERIRHEYSRFVAGMDQFDDMTAVVIKVPAAQEGKSAA
ncbi:SpoIIE family protein phosphatase [Sulfidibacter corallicola]|uniref:histidine kinase n=1 Tax=Sulfidibacter corallicola TaxID=2818388 RepID=A0A8A4U347_SULCO|nr:SpoIIE family protein phosphatase [Sulfidibacter corallicola]QTD53165.1 SpoIIE family protein phosphatase [Sulfidibacter corallicola]